MPRYPGIYKCTHCGNIVEVLHGGGGGLTCCGDAMQQMKEGAVDASREKHVPVVEKTDAGYKVTVGSAAHPMEEKHSIEWIELLVDNGSTVAFLKPGQAPQACFKSDAGNVTVRAYCNLHGLWKA
ncbi:MAG: desulfoferrodoxin [Desulfovibrio sp.]|jgi:superoxide reductase|nr:desulfoferrodoxin [Desulfovibrio sp.]